MRRTAAEAAETRQAIISSALHRFASDGWQSCSLGSVADGAGVTRGAVYHHFAGKHELLHAVLTEQWQTCTQDLYAALDGHGRPEDRLTDFLTRCLVGLREDARFRDLAVVTVVVAPQAFGSGPGTAEKQAALASLAERIGQVLDECGARPPLDVGACRFALMAFVNGATLAAALDPGELPAGQNCAALASALTGALLVPATHEQTEACSS